MADGLGVGAEQAGLGIVQTVVLAEGPDQRLGAAQVRPGHVGKQVVLDLVVQPPQHEVDQPAAAHVARGQHLAAEEVQLIGLGEGGHALVVGSERTAQVQPEQPLLDGQEDQRLQRRQHQPQGGEIGAEMDSQQQPLDRVGPAAAPEDGLDGGGVQVGGLQQQQGEEQPALVAGQQPDQPVLGAGLVGGEGQGGDADVGVQVLVVGVGVVAGVLGDPPVEADPDPQVGVEEPDQVVGPPGAEQLAVAGVVADKGDLGEDDRQVGGDGQLPPGRPDHHKGGPAAGQQGQVAADPGRV